MNDLSGGAVIGSTAGNSAMCDAMRIVWRRTTADRAVGLECRLCCSFPVSWSRFMRDSLAPVAFTAALTSALTVAGALPFAALPAAAQCAELASIAVSLVIPQTCVIASEPGLAQITSRPVVTCLHNEPYGSAQTPPDPTDPPSTLQLAAPGTR